jgi:aspartyl-tRNA synthetase
MMTTEKEKNETTTIAMEMKEEETTEINEEVTETTETIMTGARSKSVIIKSLTRIRLIPNQITECTT